MSLEPGKFEVVDKGSIFLDEIGETPPAIQAKLLRVLEARGMESAFERVSSSHCNGRSETRKIVPGRRFPSSAGSADS